MKVRIQKLLADAGVESRRHVEEMVVSGRISVNGKLVTKLPVMVDPDEDKITIDGEPIDLPAAQEQEKLYILMNKPSGVYCTNVAQGEQRRAIDLLPPEIDRRLYPVGRLDADSRGLLLLTNDGELTQKLTHPKFGVSKTYTAVVDGYVKPETVERLSTGIWLADPEKGGFKTGRSFIKVVKRATRNSVLQITIREGRNRQLRRMLAGVGHKVRELTRIKIGPLELGRLKPGGFRVLSAWEVNTLMEAIKPKAPREGKPPAAAPAVTKAAAKPARPAKPDPYRSRPPRKAFGGKGAGSRGPKRAR
ncbi:MAG TPA: pseudouridine synthase [Tepidisphaeraceae bacterium]|jgi:pseudouridine synthase